MGAARITQRWALSVLRVSASIQSIMRPSPIMLSRSRRAHRRHDPLRRSPRGSPAPAGLRRHRALACTSASARRRRTPRWGASIWSRIGRRCANARRTLLRAYDLALPLRPTVDLDRQHLRIESKASAARLGRSEGRVPRPCKGPMP